MNKADLKIFLVDDEDFCLTLLEEQLAILGCKHCFSFKNSSDCLDKLTLQPDLIFLDYQMDKINGIETLKKIKRFNPNILVVFISGQENISVAVNALKYGAFDYLLKNDVDEIKLGILLEKIIRFRQAVNNTRGNRFTKILSGIGFSPARK